MHTAHEFKDVGCLGVQPRQADTSTVSLMTCQSGCFSVDGDSAGQLIMRPKKCWFYVRNNGDTKTRSDSTLSAETWFA